MKNGAYSIEEYTQRHVYTERIRLVRVQILVPFVGQLLKELIKSMPINVTITNTEHLQMGAKISDVFKIIR